jgi:transposase
VRSTGHVDVKKSAKTYPKPLRRVKYKDPETAKVLIFLTNNTELPAKTIAQLYKARWQVELFFKWIKQNLHIESFFGQSENAVKAQIWVAIAAYLLLAIFKKELKFDNPLSEILHFFAGVLFEQTPIPSLFPELSYTNQFTNPAKQLSLLDS